NRIRLALGVELSEYRRVMARLGYDRLNFDKLKHSDRMRLERYLRKHRLGKYSPGRGRKAPRLTLGQRNAILDRVDRSSSIAKYLRSQGYSPEQIVDELSTGGAVRDRNGRVIMSWPAFGESIAKMGYEYDISGSLSRESVDQLHSMGVKIGRRLKVSPAARRR